MFVLLGIILYTFPASAEMTEIQGRITDARTHEPLPGAIVSIHDLRLTALADRNGEYILKNVPDRGRFLVEVRFLGYRTVTETIDFSTAGSHDFALQASVLEAKEVVITGSAFSSDDRKNSTSVTAMGKADLLARPANNIIDAIARMPGVSQITTGAAVSKPVIRGLSYNRVVTVADGTKQEGQQWGDEHGLEVDQFDAERVEILRGAASLLYGSDALGGVVNILDPLPAVQGQIRGEVVTNYATNNGLSGNSVMLQGNRNGFVWRGRGSYKSAYSYHTPDGYVANTGFNEQNFSGQIGLNKRWGYSHLDFTGFRSRLGLPDFERNAAGEFLDEEGNPFTRAQFRNRELRLPFQDVRHYKVALNSNLLIGSGRLRSNLAYQDNQRRELEEDRNDPSLFFNLRTYSYDLKYYFRENSGWEPVIGIAGSWQDNANKAEELLIPDYASADAGLFGYLKKTWMNRTTLNFGARLDYRKIRAQEMFEDGAEKFAAFDRNFSNMSAAAGFTHEFDDYWNFKANVGSAFRAPNIAELSSNGVHEGSFRYEIGNPVLKAEQSFYTDLGVEYSGELASASVTVYNNSIDHYIYLQGPSSVMIDGYPVYNYVQANANLKGAEASLTLHPNEVLHLENSFSVTEGTNRATDRPLPFIPAVELRNEISFEPKLPKVTKAYITFEMDNVFRQTRTDVFETPTAGYTLFNASAGATFRLKNQPVRVSVAANNLFDKAYFSHLSRLKYEGILNQGRNISVGLHVPFVLK
ncbi:MAG TPA: TonB-dependent receptor [Sphingobacteriaceae bacterium]